MGRTGAEIHIADEFVAGHRSVVSVCAFCVL